MSDLADRLAIRELLDRYVLAVDSHEVEAFVDLFWDDAAYVSPFGVAEGRDAIAASIAQWHASGVTAGKRHFAGPASIRVAGSSAHVQATYFVLEAAEAPPRVVASGGYTDLLEKRDGAWRLLRREQTVDPSYQPSDR